MTVSHPLDRLKSIEVLFVEDRVPDPRIGYGFSRAHEILVMLSNLVGRVNVAVADVHSARYAAIEGSISVPVISLNDEPARFRHLADKAVVLWICRQKNMHDITKKGWLSSIPAKVVFDAESLTFRRLRIEADLNGGTFEVAEDIERRERCLTKVADVNVFVNKWDAQTAADEWGAKNVHIVSHSHSAPSATSAFSERRGVLFVGGFYKIPCPNVDALEFFLSEVWPRVPKELRIAHPLTVAGCNVNRLMNVPRISSLIVKDVCLISDFLDARPLYDRHRMAVIPTRIASGLPFKATEAVVNRLPFVTTPLISKQLGMPVAASDDPTEMACMVERLLTDPEFWRSYSELLDSAAPNYSRVELKRSVACALCNALGVEGNIMERAEMHCGWCARRA